MYRRTFISIYLSLCLIQAGCTTSPPVASAPTDEIRSGFGTIGVVTGRFTPKVRFEAPERVKGAGDAAGRTAGRALGTMWAVCGGTIAKSAPLIFVPIIVGAACVVATPVVAVGGALVGGGNSSAAKANRAAQEARAPEVKALRGAIDPALAAVASERPLHARLLKQVTSHTQGTVVSVTNAGPSSPRRRPRYKDLARTGIDTVLEVTVQRLDVSIENAFVLTARARVIRLADREELYANTHTFHIGPRSVSEWTDDGGDNLGAALVSGYQALADEIANELFAKEAIASRSSVR